MLLTLFGPLVAGLLTLSAATQECSRGFSVVSPEVAAPGKTTAVLVTLHGASRRLPLNVTLRLLSDHVEEASQAFAEVTQEILGQGIIPLPVPSGRAGSYILQTMVNCTQIEDCNELQSSSVLRLVGVVRDVVLRANRKIYRPGDTVTFWALALDHDLQLTADVIGEVNVRDPHGNKVALWEEVSLDEGVRKFEFRLSEGAALGYWGVHVEVDQETFSTHFNVTLTGDNSDLAPEVAMAEEHYVELKFGHEMRRVYKPGLPFLGKVEAVSTEKSVRVRVKVYDNTTAIYSQDIEISSGEGSFVVPAILADSDVITLQAELVSVEGKEIDSHYVLAKEPIKKWNSTSDCYLLIDGIETALQPDEEYHGTVLSTCSCEANVQYVITTGGHVTYWSESQQLEAQDTTSQGIDGVAFCRLNFSFPVEAVMAPVSVLLVYYVAEDGEPISDVVMFDVNLLQRELSFSVDEREYWLPSEPMNVVITAPMSSVVCLIGGRSSPDSKGSTLQTQTKPQTHGQDFLFAGVSFFHRHCEHPEFFRHDTHTHQSVITEANLDQLWMWTCFNYSDSMAEKGVSITAPDESGRWSLWALTHSQSSGLRFSAPHQLNVFRPLQVYLRLPPNLRVGETVQVDVRITNNINTCVDVTALLALSEGAHFLSSRALYVTDKLRLGPHGATSLVVRVVVTTPGNKNMTAEVSGYASDTCRESGAVSHNNSIMGSAVRSAAMTVHPEGLVRIDTESAYFCANEHVVISTSESYRYEWVGAPRNAQGVVFEVKVGGGAHLALSDATVATERMYQLVLGDVSWVGRGKHGFGVHLTNVDTPGLLSPDEFRTFWISWERGTICFGRGPRIQFDTLLKWRMDKKMKVLHLGFASAWGTVAEFRVWNYNDEAGFSQVLHLDVPRSVVPGTEQGTLMISGGLALPLALSEPSLSDPASLTASISSFTSLLLPSPAANGSSPSEALSLRLQNLMAFRKEDNSFGDHHKFGSHHSTISILELLTKTQTYLNVDPTLMTGIKQWVLQRQASDGSFSPSPQEIVPTSESENQLNRDVETTAETLAALLELGLETEADSEVLLKARYFLEKNLFRVWEPCPVALLTFALVLSKSELAYVALDHMRNASTNEEGDFGWPHPVSNKDGPDWLYEEGSSRHNKEPIRTSVGGYKASLFALMTYSILGDLKSAEPVARFLFYRSHVLDKHAELLYTAVKAFAAFGSLAFDRHRSLTVSLATSGMELTDTLELRPDSEPQTLQLPSLPTKVFVYATGAGCATVQGRVSYSTYSPSRRTPLLELWAGVEEEISPGRNSLEELEGRLPSLHLQTCFVWRGKTASPVLRLEVSLFSGYELVDVRPIPGVDMRYGARNNHVWFVIANVNVECGLCVRFTAMSVHVVTSLRPAFARIYPVHRADLAAETFFHTKRGSPLLAEVTDDDLITWFGRVDSTQLDLSSNFSTLCECGKPCPQRNTTDEASQVTATQTTVAPTNYPNTSVQTSTETVADALELLEVITVNVSASPVNESQLTESVEHSVSVNKAKIAEPPTTTVDSTTVGDEATTTAHSQSRSINKEKYHAVLPTADPPEGRSHKLGSDKLVVVDRDTLWGMLREVVHVELNNNLPIKEKPTKNKNSLK